jgi:hypothetical protein
MSDTKIQITAKLAEELEGALNLAIGMASMHSKESVPSLISTASKLTDAINAEDTDHE